MKQKGARSARAKARFDFHRKFGRHHHLLPLQSSFRYHRSDSYPGSTAASTVVASSFGGCVGGGVSVVGGEFNRQFYRLRAKHNTRSIAFSSSATLYDGKNYFSLQQSDLDI